MVHWKGCLPGIQARPQREEQAWKKEACSSTAMGRLAQDWVDGQRKRNRAPGPPCGAGFLAHHAQRAQGPLTRLASRRAEDGGQGA